MLYTGNDISKPDLYAQVSKPAPATKALPIGKSNTVLYSGLDPGTMLNIKWFSPSFQLKHN